jgi:hypothetical protein
LYASTVFLLDLSLSFCIDACQGVEMPVAAMGVWQYKPDEAEAAIKLALQVLIFAQRCLAYNNK